MAAFHFPVPVLWMSMVATALAGVAAGAVVLARRRHDPARLLPYVDVAAYNAFPVRP